MTVQLNHLIRGWRGFLIGDRRRWHAHHRLGVQGVRAGTLAVRSAVQLSQLRRWVNLVVDVFCRGGSIWLFGVGNTQTTRWGLIRPNWRPGRLSNYFFFRLQRTKFVARSRRVWNSRRIRRRRTRRRLGRRLIHGVRRRVQRPDWDPSRGARVRPAGMAVLGWRRFTKAARHYWASPARTPQAGRWRARPFRRWWRYTAGRRPFRARRGPGVGRRSARGAIAVLVRRHRLRRRRRYRLTRRARTRLFCPGWVRPTFGSLRSPDRGRRVRARRVSRHVRWVRPFPTVVLLGGVTLLKATLFNEIQATGVVLVRFGGVDFVPRRGLLEVYWNNAAASLDGLPDLLTDLHTRSVRTGLFRVCWRRLARLAER